MRQQYLEALKPHQKVLTRHCHALCSGERSILPQDVVQETLLKSFNRFEEYDEQGSFRAWLLQIATYTFLSMRRKAIVRKAVSLQIIPELVLEKGRMNSDDSLEAKDVLERAFKVLTKREKVALVMYHISGFPISDIAEFQRDRSLSATKSRLSRGRKKLKTEVERLERWSVSTDNVTIVTSR